VVKLPVVTLNFVEVAPAPTITDADAVSAVLLLVSVTVTPPVGAVVVMVRVQALDAFTPRAVGLQDTDDGNNEAVRLMLAVAELLL
jgi:hypothetical protein